jgi:ion channel-forming bestrophin family protein
LFKRVVLLRKKGIITDNDVLIINAELTTFTDVCGACERIKNTPIPFSYNLFIKKFIFVYIMTLPFGFVFSLGYFVIPVVGFIFYVLASLELIAEEIEDPFGNDNNDLPMKKISENIRKSIEEIL